MKSNIEIINPPAIPHGRRWEERFVQLAAKDGITIHMHYFNTDFGAARVIRPGPTKGGWFRNDPYWGAFDWFSEVVDINIVERNLIHAAKQLADEISKEYPTYKIKIRMNAEVK